MMNREILEYMPATPFGFDNLMFYLLADKYDVKVESFSGYWLDIGRPDENVQVIEDFENMKNRPLYE